MKRLNLLCFLLLLGAQAYGAPWGALSDYDVPRSRSNSATNRPASASADAPGESKRGESYLLKKILAGKTIKVYVSEEEPGSNEPSVDAESSSHWQNLPAAQEKRPSRNLADRQKLVEKMYKLWFSHTESVIRKAHRRKEFADILPFLEQSVSVSFVPEAAQADIAIYIVDFDIVQQHCSDTASGCYSHPEGTVPVIWLPRDQVVHVKGLRYIEMDTFWVGVHEVGHALGLSDQYVQAADNNSHAVYASTNREHGIMEGGNSKRMSCDDADGLINLIDITRNVRSERNEYGWRSLCPKSKDVYSYGTPATRGPYAWHTNNMDEGAYLTTYQKRDSSSQFFPWSKKMPASPFQTLREIPMKYDQHNRVVWAQGEHGEDVYYIYQYAAKTRMVTWNKELVLLERKYPEYSLHRNRWMEDIDHSMTFKRGNTMVNLHARYNREQGGMANYTEGAHFEDTNPSKALILLFDKNKKTIDVIDSTAMAEQHKAETHSHAFSSQAEQRLSSVDYAVTRQAQKQQQSALSADIEKWFHSKYP